MIQVKHIKKVTSFLLIFVTALLLVACSKKENVPYGSITDKEYLNVGDVTITEKELYNNLRRDSQSFLSKLIEENMFADYKDEAVGLLTSDETVKEDSREELVRKMFDENINQKIFNTKDLEAIEDLPEINRVINIENFVNSVYQLDASVNRIDLKDKINEKIDQMDVENEVVGYYNIELLLNLYVIDIQKHLYAEKQLELDVLDKDSAQYMDPENISSIINHYKNNEKDQYDVNIFYFYFLNINEANSAFRELSVKTSTSGHYYNVPNIRYVAEYEKNIDNPAMKDALDKADLTDYFKKDFEGKVLTGITERQFSNFYNAYSVSDAKDTKLNDYDVLNLFVKLYNLVNEYRVESEENPEDFKLINGIYVDGDGYDDETKFSDPDLIKYNDNEKTPFDSEMSREDLNKLNSSFANYIYKELNEDKPYSTLRSVGNRRYLAFKLSKDVYELDYVSAEKDEDNKEQWVTIKELKDFLSDEKNKDEDKQKLVKQLQELNPDINGIDITEEQWNTVKEVMDKNIADWTVKVKDAKLTSSYTSTRVGELIKDAKIEIYDPVIRTFYNQSGEAKGGNKTGKYVAKVTYKIGDDKKSFEIEVDELFNLLEANNGLELALDLAFNKLLLEQYNEGFFKEYKDEINIKEFKKEYKELIKNFSNDAFAQAGYPASIGREAFLQNIFGATNPNDAIELGYVVPKLRELFFENVELGLGQFSDINTNDALYDVLADFSEKQRKHFTGVSVHHLLVFFDKDGSGNPVDPEEHLKTLSVDQRKEVENAIIELYQEIVLDKVSSMVRGPQDPSTTSKIDLQSFVDAFNSGVNGKPGIISEFEDSIRFGDKTIELQKYRKLGINLKFEDISSVITNTSNLPYQSSTLDKVFYNRVMELYTYIIEEADANDDLDLEDSLKNILPYMDFGGDLNNIDSGDMEILNNVTLDKVKSGFGYHFILVDTISEKESAKYNPTSSELEDPKYSFKLDDKDEKSYNIYSDESLDEDKQDFISKSQIEYYILGKKKDAVLPTSVEKAFNAYFAPVYSLYTGDAMKQAIFYSFLSNSTLVLSEDQTARFNTLKELNKTSFSNYMNIVEDMENSYYSSWDALYGDWFEAFGLE